MSKHMPERWELVSRDAVLTVQTVAGLPVCTMHGVGPKTGSCDDVETRARLIAAAPDLLEGNDIAEDALRIAAETICADPDHNVAAMACIELARRELRARRAKATGEAQ